MKKANAGRDLMTRGDLLKIVRLTPRQVQYWDETGLLIPRLKTKRRRYYDFANVVEFKMVESLLREGFSTQRIRGFIAHLKRMMPKEESLLARLQIHTDGQTLIFQEKGAYFETNGQGLLRLDLEQLYHRIRPRALLSNAPMGTRERGSARVRQLRGLRSRDGEIHSGRRAAG